ncbi:LysR family transcriptional regulator [Polaromonas sp. YR568]|uniref:LysR family transcriptional regulator n=1 Tax=Polaromonas sp. YR568 TaxID=1855301 RepID=UPI0031384208
MKISYLATLLAILDKGSFTAAAEVVGCTPGAVSLQVKQLEIYFGKPLFDRSSRLSRPTSFALELGQLARETTSRIQALRTRPTLTVAGRLQLGAINSIQSDLLPCVLRALKDEHLALEVSVSSLVDSEDLLDAVNAGKLDAAALVRPKAGASSRLIWEDLAKQPFVMLAPAGVKDARPQDLLRKSAWIGYDRQLTGGRIAAEYVRRVAPGSRAFMELGSIDAIVAMVSQGLGISVVPLPREQLISSYDLRVVPLGRNGPSRQLSFVRRKADEDSRNVNAARDAFLSVLANRRASLDARSA